MTPGKQREELELENRADILELNRMKEKIEENVKKINNENNQILELKKEEKILQNRIESRISEGEAKDYHEKISQIKQHMQQLAITASQAMRHNNELIQKRNELVERINMRDYILRQSEASLMRVPVKKVKQPRYISEEP